MSMVLVVKPVAGNIKNKGLELVASEPALGGLSETTTPCERRQSEKNSYPGGGSIWQILLKRPFGCLRGSYSIEKRNTKKSKQ
jgi:hypothetical protein